MKNKTFLSKLIIMICLIGVCFIPNVYAGDAYLKTETVNKAVPDSPVPNLQNVTYIYIPFTSTGENTEEAKIGDVTIVATTEKNALGISTTKYSAILPDGTPTDNLDVVITKPDGSKITVPIPSIDNLIYGNVYFSSDIKVELDYEIPEGSTLSVSYEDEGGNDQSVDLGATEDVMETVDYTYIDDKPKLLSPESMFSDLLNGIANGINLLIAIPIGYQITIDDIVFNKYPATKVDYFKDLKGGQYSEIIWGTDGNGNGGLSYTVNQCYSFFNKIAVLVYMVMLVYMGLRIILSSTGQSLSHFKTLFMYWVVGVAILFLYPYAMKYIIQINDTFVGMVEANKGSSYVAVQDRNSIPALTPSSMWSLDLSKNPFDGAGNDYMSMIANDANESRRLAMSFAYIILTWQLITLILHYYKRLFMIGFLIAIFPLVAMFYALDKVGDGKSQAFDHWNKEFMLNVLIQSFHAVVYVFVCGSIGATRTGAYGFDYILIITGTTFLFTGEQIVKGIFSQNSGVKAGAAKGLADTAAWSMAKVQIGTTMAAKATRNLIGRDSAAMRLRNAHNVRKATGAKLAVFDAMATPVASPNAGLRFESTQATMNNIDNNTALSDEQKQASKAEALKLANAVADINNPHTRSVEELQKAYDTVRHAMQTDPNNAILGDLKLSEGQLGAVDAIGREVANMVANHVTDPVEIQSKVTATLGYTLEGLSEEEKNKYINMALFQVAKHGATRYDDPLGSAEDEIESGARALTRAFSTFNYRSASVGLNETQELKRAQVQQAAEDWAKSFHEDGSEATDEEKELAEGLMIIANRKSGLYTAEEYLSATEKIKRNLEHNSDATREMSKSLDMDIDLLRHGIASKAKAEGNTSSEIEEIIEEYEVDLRDGVYDDEVSGHELISIINESDSVEREHKKQRMINDVSTARMKANSYEREETRAIAAAILENRRVDVTQGGIDKETRFLNGQTREDILKERRAASFGVVLETAGLGDKYSKKYKENMENYQQHLRGDQEGDYHYKH